MTYELTETPKVYLKKGIDILGTLLLDYDYLLNPVPDYGVNNIYWDVSARRKYSISYIDEDSIITRVIKQWNKEAIKCTLPLALDATIGYHTTDDFGLALNARYGWEPFNRIDFHIEYNEKAFYERMASYEVNKILGVEND